MKKQANFPARQHEAGSALIWILVMVFLFGALSVVMNRGSRTGDNNISAERARLGASEIIDYAGAIRRAVRELRINGCTESQISFESPQTGTQYQNVSAPSDYSCHVFHPDGAGLRYALPSENLFDQARYVGFDTNHCIKNIGTTNDPCDKPSVDLVMSVYALSREVCIAINNALGNGEAGSEPGVDSSSHASSGGGNGPFTGTYGPLGMIVVGNSATAISGKIAGCYQDSGGYSDDYYIFYQVLLAR